MCKLNSFDFKISEQTPLPMLPGPAGASPRFTASVLSQTVTVCSASHGGIMVGSWLVTIHGDHGGFN